MSKSTFVNGILILQSVNLSVSPTKPGQSPFTQENLKNCIVEIVQQLWHCGNCPTQGAIYHDGDDYYYYEYSCCCCYCC